MKVVPTASWKKCLTTWKSYVNNMKIKWTTRQYGIPMCTIQLVCHQKFSTYLNNRPTINCVLLAFSRFTPSVVVQHLLNLSFWVTSLQANDGFMYFGNLTTHYPLSITLDNFAGKIDSGAPSPTESGMWISKKNFKFKWMFNVNLFV